MTKATALTPREFSPSGTSEPSFLHAALWAPWRATKRANLWMVMPTFGAMCITALVIGALMRTPRGQLLAVMCYGMGAAFFAWFCLASLALLARDARALALPGVVPNSTLSAILYAACGIAIPALIETAFGWNGTLAALVVALMLVGGLAFTLLPRWISTWMGFIPAIYIPLHRSVHALSPFDPRFVYWSLPLLLVLGVAVALRWRAVILGDFAEAGAWQRPMLLQMRQQAVAKRWTLDNQLLSSSACNSHRYMDLHGIDARTPVKAIEVALGPLFVPLTPVGKLRRFGFGLWPLLLFGVAMVATNLSNSHDLHRSVAIVGASGVLGAGIMGLAMAAALGFIMLQRRWESSEPALLALLPGLGQHAPLYQSVARAAFRKTAMAFAALWLLLTASVLFMHAGVLGTALVTLVVAVSALAPALLLLHVFAAQPIRMWLQSVIAAFTFVLLCASIPVAVALPKLTSHWPGAIWIEWGLIATCLVYGGSIAWFTLRAWRTLARRPHPFLACAR